MKPSDGAWVFSLVRRVYAVCKAFKPPKQIFQIIVLVQMVGGVELEGIQASNRWWMSSWMIWNNVPIAILLGQLSTALAHE